MKILGLPGINPATEQWMKQLLVALELNQTEIAIQQYQCWSNPGSKVNLESEALIAAKSNPDIVIAKSIGTRVLLSAIRNGLISSNTFVLIGIPIQGYSNNEVSVLNKLCALKSTLIIQQSGDPVGSYSMLTSTIPDISLCKMVEIQGNDHRYSNIAELKLIIEQWYRSFVIAQS